VPYDQLKLVEKEKQISDAKKAHEELKRKLEQGSQQLQGEVLEHGPRVALALMKQNFSAENGSLAQEIEASVAGESSTYETCR
jgi:hypothetical protein